jgi:hypothetical protein
MTAQVTRIPPNALLIQADFRSAFCGKDMSEKKQQREGILGIKKHLVLSQALDLYGGDRWT